MENIQIIKPQISWAEYEQAKTRAGEVAEYINGIEVTDDNIKEAKKKLAEARKLIKAIDDRRKEVKNEIMEPYKVLEAQIKEVTTIIDEADSRLSDDIRAMEDAEKEAKEKCIRDIWEKRIRQYSITTYVPDAWDFFFSYRYLNKTVSMKSIEKEMTNFLEEAQADIDGILQNSAAEEIMVEYAGTMNYRDAIENVRKAREYKESVFESKAEEDKAIFEIKGKLAINSVRLFCEQNEIEFKLL